MKYLKIILPAALVLAAVSCGKVDPSAIDDPISDGNHLMVTITVGRDPETKTSVSGAGKVSFTENDQLTLFQTVEHASGGTTTSIIKSNSTSLISGGQRASFLFDINTSGITVNDDISYRAATGDWSLDTDSAPVVTVPSSLDPSSYSGSVLPPNGVITVSDRMSASVTDISDVLNASVRLNHVVDYGVLDIQGLPDNAAAITGIAVSNPSSTIVGPARFDFETCTFTDASSSALTITPSEEQQSQMKNNNGTAIWFTRIPANTAPGKPSSLTVTLKDEDGNEWQGQFSEQRSPDEPIPPTGSLTNVSIGTWNDLP